MRAAIPGTRQLPCEKEPQLFLLKTNFMPTITTSSWPKTSKWFFCVFLFLKKAIQKVQNLKLMMEVLFFHAGSSAQPRILHILPSYFKRVGHSLAALTHCFPHYFAYIEQHAIRKKSSSKWTHGIKSHTAYLKQLYVALEKKKKKIKKITQQVY